MLNASPHLFSLQHQWHTQTHKSCSTFTIDQWQGLDKQKNKTVCAYNSIFPGHNKSYGGASCHEELERVAVKKSRHDQTLKNTTEALLEEFFLHRDAKKLSQWSLLKNTKLQGSL